jgi:hypothetical protein
MQTEAWLNVIENGEARTGFPIVRNWRHRRGERRATFRQDEASWPALR